MVRGSETTSLLVQGVVDVGRHTLAAAISNQTHFIKPAPPFAFGLGAEIQGNAFGGVIGDSGKVTTARITNGLTVRRAFSHKNRVVVEEQGAWSVR